jgi:hypothetical protein
MHCPACGQQQVSAETKFCSRCGMPLSLVSEVVAHGGYLPQLAQLAQMGHKKPWFSKKNGVLFGVIWFIFFTMFSTALLGILNAPEELIAIIAVTGVFGAMMIIIGSLVGLPSSKPPQFNTASLQWAPSQLRQPAEPGALPPQTSVPAGGYAVPAAGRWRDTNDLEPASVTESTTRLLREDER